MGLACGMSDADKHPTRQRLVAAPAPGLCLDFANTCFWRGSEAPTESLADYAALAQWLLQAAVIDVGTAASLALLPGADADAARQLFKDALQLRELMYRLFAAEADAESEGGGGGGDAADNKTSGEAQMKLDAAELAGWIARTPPRQQGVFDHRGPPYAGWQLPMHTPSAAEVLAPVLWSAADLLLALQRLRLRACANPKCRWLFLDDSKAGSRRWCSMSSCGNRAKVRRHFLRHSGKEAG